MHYSFEALVGRSPPCVSFTNLESDSEPANKLITMNRKTLLSTFLNLDFCQWFLGKRIGLIISIFRWIVWPGTLARLKVS